MSKEQYYDDHIAPKLLALGEECKENGLSLLAVCEWGSGEYGRTLVQLPDSSFAFRLIDTAARSQGNVDRLMMAMTNHAGEHGHSSIFLSQLGVPTKPTKEIK